MPLRDLFREEDRVDLLEARLLDAERLDEILQVDEVAGVERAPLADRPEVVAQGEADLDGLLAVEEVNQRGGDAFQVVQPEEETGVFRRDLDQGHFVMLPLLETGPGLRVEPDDRELAQVGDGLVRVGFGDNGDDASLESLDRQMGDLLFGDGARGILYHSCSSLFSIKLSSSS